MDSIATRVAARFAALGEPTRLRLVRELARRDEAAVQELADAVGAPIANVSKHLHVLYNAELVARRREGTRVLYRLAQQAVWEICEDMEAVACAAMVSPVDGVTSFPAEATADFGARSRILRR